jgi:HEPN domain-containing protein
MYAFDLDQEATRDALAAKAAQAGQSLQEYLLARLIEIGRTRDIEVLLGEMKEIRKRWPKQITREQILEALDEGRREADEKWDRLWE